MYTILVAATQSAAIIAAVQSALLAPAQGRPHQVLALPTGAHAGHTTRAESVYFDLEEADFLLVYLDAADSAAERYALICELGLAAGVGTVAVFLIDPGASRDLGYVRQYATAVTTGVAEAATAIAAMIKDDE